jgi:predicted membrane protein
MAFPPIIPPIILYIYYLEKLFIKEAATLLQFNGFTLDSLENNQFYTGAILGILFGIWAAYLCWVANKNIGWSYPVNILFTFIAFSFSIYYILFYYILFKADVAKVAKLSRANAQALIQSQGQTASTGWFGF